MLAFIQSSMSGDFEQRVSGLTGQMKKPAFEAQDKSKEMPSAPDVPVGSAAMLLQLVTIVSQIASVDKMIADMVASAPDAEEAKKWHEVSLQALQWSRDALSEKQANCLADLSALAGLDEAKETAMPLPLQPVPEAPKDASTWGGWSKNDVAACAAFVPQAEQQKVCSGSLRQDLELLRESNPERVLIVRKIKKLGFESPAYLEEHFGKYGEVADVMVAHSHVKPTTKRPNGRVRPAALGFVVMGSESSVQRALQGGEEQVVGGVAIEVRPFLAFDFSGDEKEWQ